MFLQKKTKGYFAEFNSHSTLLARTSAAGAPLVVEDCVACSADNSAQLNAALDRLHPKRGTGYLRATCGIYSRDQMVRHATLDPKRYREANYLNEVVSTQFRVDPDKYSLAVIDSSTGLDLDLTAAPQKEVLFAGLPSEEIDRVQAGLLEKRVYPERLELATLATLGALVDYFAFSEAKTPTLVLEIGSDTTQSFIVTGSGVDISRPIPQGFDAMIPVVQKEIGLKDEESARKLFYSNTFDFTNIAGSLIKKLLKELQSSIGFYEVQTGQSIGQVICTQLSPKLNWLEGAIASQLGVSVLAIDFISWMKARNITFEKAASKELDNRWLGLLSLMLDHNHAIVSKKES